MILAASFVFYGWWDWRFIFLLGASIVINQTGAVLASTLRDPRSRAPGHGRRHPRRRRAAGLVQVLRVLLGQRGQRAAPAGRCSSPLPVLQVALPVGISFFTFMGISYVVDVHRGKIAAGQLARRRRLPVVLPPPRRRAHRAGVGAAPAAAGAQGPQADRRVTGGVADHGRSGQEGGHLVVPVEEHRRPGVRRPAPALGARGAVRRSTATPSRSTPTSAATPTSPSAWRCCSASASPRTSTPRTPPSPCRTSGGDGT